MRNQLLTCALIVCGFFATTSQAQNINQEIQNQAQNSIMFMLQNISRADAAPGSVVASPSRQDPNYYYNWIRDAALTMDTVVYLYGRSSGEQQQTYRKILLDYVSFSRRNQMTPNRSGGLGEPKFMPDGSAFNGDWGRPQNDGPALRAITLIHFAGILMNQGQDDYVRKVLYDGAIPTNSVIKSDLEYVAHHWQEPCFDLWEEINGHHFFTLIVQRASMVMGARLADRLGDGGAASFYRDQAQQIGNALKQFWDPGRGILVETLGQISGISKSGLDTAIILGVLHGDAGDGFLSVTNDMVMSTASHLIKAFQQIYGINHSESDLAPAIGRYPEDVYNGDGVSQGNPWFLTTLAFSQLCYQMRIELAHSGSLRVTDLNKPFLSFVLDGRADLQSGMVISKGDPQFGTLMAALGETGDAFMKRVLFHKGPDGSLSEEINRNTGYMQGAENLTWSHAAFIMATAWRYLAL